MRQHLREAVWKRTSHCLEIQLCLENFRIPDVGSGRCRFRYSKFKVQQSKGLMFSLSVSTFFLCSHMPSIIIWMKPVVAMKFQANEHSTDFQLSPEMAFGLCPFHLAMWCLAQWGLHQSAALASSKRVHLCGTCIHPIFGPAAWVQLAVFHSSHIVAHTAGQMHHSGFQGVQPTWCKLDHVPHLHHDAYVFWQLHRHHLDDESGLWSCWSCSSPHLTGQQSVCMRRNVLCYVVLGQAGHCDLSVIWRCWISAHSKAPNSFPSLSQPEHVAPPPSLWHVWLVSASHCQAQKPTGQCLPICVFALLVEVLQ